LARKFKKFLKFQKQSKDAKKFEKFKNKGESIPRDKFEKPKRDESNMCFGCKGYGYKVVKCPTRLKKEGNKPIAYNATLIDSEPEEGESSPIEHNLVSFMSCHVIDDDISSPEDTHVHDTSEAVESASRECEGDESEDEEIDVGEFQAAFRELFEETVKVKNANSKLKAKLNEHAVENNDALIEDLRVREKKLR